MYYDSTETLVCDLMNEWERLDVSGQVVQAVENLGSPVELFLYFYPNYDDQNCYYMNVVDTTTFGTIVLDQAPVAFDNDNVRKLLEAVSASMVSAFEESMSSYTQVDVEEDSRSPYAIASYKMIVHPPVIEEPPRPTYVLALKQGNVEVVPIILDSEPYHFCVEFRPVDNPDERIGFLSRCPQDEAAYCASLIGFWHDYFYSFVDLANTMEANNIAIAVEKNEYSQWLYFTEDFLRANGVNINETELAARQIPETNISTNRYEQVANPGLISSYAPSDTYMITPTLMNMFDMMVVPKVVNYDPYRFQVEWIELGWNQFGVNLHGNISIDAPSSEPYCARANWRLFYESPLDFKADFERQNIAEVVVDMSRKGFFGWPDDTEAKMYYTDDFLRKVGVL